MNGMLSGLITAVILIALVFFGYWFNLRVEALGPDADGFTWLLVVIGVSVTIVGIALIDLLVNVNAGLLSLVAFACSGFFMVYGAVTRYITLRRRLKELAKHDAPQTLAK